MTTKTLLAAAVAAAFTTPALAAPVAVVTGPLTGPAASLDRAAEDAFTNGRRVVKMEDFEGFSAPTRNPVGSGAPAQISTAVGTFTDNDTRTVQSGKVPGQGIGVLSAATTPFKGRFNTTVGGDNWLDSFDSEDVTWTFTPGNNWTGIGFFMTDVNDQGGDLTIDLLGAQGVDPITFPTSGDRNNRGWYVAITFGGHNVTGLRFQANDANDADGWSIDDVSAVAPVPLPAAAWLLATAMGGFGWVGRKRRGA